MLDMDTEDGAEVIDLTISDDDEDMPTTTLELVEESNEVASKRPNEIKTIMVPKVSPLSDRAPTLDPVVQTPEFNLVEVASLYYESPPIPQPQVEAPVAERENTVPIITNVQGSLRNNGNGTSLALLGNPSKYGTREECRTQPLQFIHQSLFGKTDRISQLNVSGEKTQDLMAKRDRVIQKLGGGDNTERVKNNNEIKRINKRKKSHENTTQNKKNRSDPGPSRRHENRPKVQIERTPKQNAVLKHYYRLNPNPTASKVHEIAVETNLTTGDVKRWYYSQKRSASAVVTYTVVTKQPESRQQSVENAVQGSGPSKLKCIKDPDKRTKSLEIIKQDMEKAGNCNLDQIRLILKNKWELKAMRIFKLTTDKELMSKFQPKIYLEAQRIKDLIRNPFSTKQWELISQWKTDFIAKQEQFSTMSLEEIKHVVESTIMPWVVPFLYSKLTLQDGQNLTLELALLDFSRISNSELEWKWETPLLLQNDDVNRSLQMVKRV